MATAQTTDDISLDGSAFHRGRWRQLVGMTLSVAVVLGVAVYLLWPGDEAAYRAVGKTVNGLDQQSFDSFMACVVGSQNVERVKNNLTLEAMVEQQAVAGKRFGEKLRERCMPELDGLSAGLEGVIPPASLEEEVTTLRDSVEKLRTGWSGYIAHLEDLDGSYDPDDEEADRTLGQAIEGWHDYKVALNQLNGKLRSKLEG